MFQNELSNDLWIIFNKILDDNKLKLSTVGAFQNELCIYKRDLLNQIKNLKRELEEAKSELKETKLWKLFFKGAIVERVRAGILPYELIANKEIEGLVVKNKVALEELAKQAEVIERANKVSVVNLILKF